MREHTAHFGDKLRVFRLDATMIVELERITGVGIGGVMRRMLDGSYLYEDVRQTIRAGLIGGGADPETAVRLVAVYVDGQPIEPSYSLAVSILEAAWFGPDKIEGGVSLSSDGPTKEAADA